MNPYKLREVYKQLTSQNSILKKYLKLGTKDIKQPDLPAFVETKDAINRFVRDNPRPDQLGRKDMAAGGMLAQPSADGSRQEYATSTVKTKKFKYPKNYYNSKTKKVETVYMDKPPKSSAKEVGSGKFSMGERNRVTRIKYPEYNSYAELLKKEPAKAKNVMATLQYSSVAGSKIKKKTQLTPLTTIQQNKILAEFPNANFDNGKLGFNAHTDQTRYQQVKRFIERGYKPKFKKIPLKLQEEIKQKFSYFKDWDFDKYKYGVPGSGGGSKTGRINRENNILAQRVKVYISEPKPFKLAFSMDRPGSWMLQQMYRAWEHGNTDYEPIYNKNDKVIGMKEKGKAYYANENVAPSNKVKLINSHPEFNKVQKFVDIANEAKLPLKDLGGYKNTKSLLALFPEGYESIKFSDLTNYLYQEQGADITRNAIEKHHLKNLSDMGSPIDSKNLQLLRQDLNTLGNTITQQIKKGDLSRVGDLEKAGVKITVDGKTYGKGFQDPRRQLNRIIGDVTQKISSLDEKQFNSLLAKIGCPGLASGGRAGFVEGADCPTKGANLINSGMKNASPAQLKNFAAFANRARGLGRGLMKFGIIPEAMYVAADSAIRLTMGDKPIEALLRASEYLLPGDQTKLAEMMEATRLMNPETAAIIGRSLDYKNQLAKIQSLEDTRANLENLSGGGEFDYIGDLNNDVRNLDNQIKQATNALNTQFKMTDAEKTYADAMQAEVDDRRKSKSLITKLQSMFRDTGQDSDIETLGAPEVTQEQLNKRMTDLLPRDLLLASEAEMLQAAKVAQAQGIKIPDDYYIQQQQAIKNMSLAELAAATSPEQVYGAQGYIAEPLNKGTVEKPQNIIGDMEREITGQTNVANPFDLDLSMIGSGLRGFSAAKGGRAGFESGTIPGGYTDDAYAYLREIDDEIFNSYKKYKAGGGKMKYGQYAYNAKREMFGPFGVGVGRLKRAGGGIAKEAGVDSGAPPESGPNPQGLSYLMKRGKNI